MTYREYAKQTNKTWTEFATGEAKSLLSIDNELTLEPSEFNEDTKSTFKFRGVNKNGTTMKEIVVDMDGSFISVYNFNEYSYRSLVCYKEGFDLLDMREDYAMPYRADRVFIDYPNDVEKIYKDRCITEVHGTHVIVRSFYTNEILAEFEKEDFGYFLSKKGAFSLRSVGDVWIGDDFYMDRDEFLYWYEFKKLPITKDVVTDLRNNEELGVRMGVLYPCEFLDELCDEIKKYRVTYEDVIEFKKKGSSASDSNPIFMLDTLDRHRLANLY